MAGSVRRVVATLENVDVIPQVVFLHVDGLPASWFSLPRPSVVLDPGQSRQIALALHPPHDVSTAMTACTLTAFAPYGEQDSATLALPVSVAAARGVSISVAPLEVTERRGTFHVRAYNHQPNPVALNLLVRGIERRLRMQVEPGGTIVLGAGQTAEVVVRARALRKMNHVSAIEVTGVVIADGATKRIPGGRVLFTYAAGRQHPRLLRPLGSVLLLLSLLAVTLFIVRPHVTELSRPRANAPARSPARIPLPSPPTSTAASSPTIAPAPLPRVTGGFEPGEPVTIAVDGVAVTTTTADKAGGISISSALLGGRGGSISATGARDGRSTVVASTPRRGTVDLYSAGSQNTTHTRTTVDLLNTGTTTAPTTLRFFFADGATSSAALQLAPHQSRTVPVVSATSRHGAFGLAVQTRGSVAARLSMERVGRANDTIALAPESSRTWYFAEGYTWLSFRESLYIFNPHPTRAAHVTLAIASTSPTATTRTMFVVAPHSIHEIDVRRLAPGHSVSVAIGADLSIVAQRSLTFSATAGRQGYGAVEAPGAARAAATWFFPMGTPPPRGETYVSVLNPGPAIVHATMRLYAPDGSLVFTHAIDVGARSRASIAAPQALLKTTAAVVKGDAPVVVERLSYLGPPNGLRVSGFTVQGANGAASRWAFATSDLSAGHDVLGLYNPASRPVQVALRVYSANGMATSTIIVGPHGSRALNAASLEPSLGRPTGVVVLTDRGVGIVAALTFVAGS